MEDPTIGSSSNDNSMNPPRQDNHLNLDFANTVGYMNLSEALPPDMQQYIKNCGQIFENQDDDKSLVFGNFGSGHQPAEGRIMDNISPDDEDADSEDDSVEATGVREQLHSDQSRLLSDNESVSSYAKHDNRNILESKTGGANSHPAPNHGAISQLQGKKLNPSNDANSHPVPHHGATKLLWGKKLKPDDDSLVTSAAVADLQIQETLFPKKPSLNPPNSGLIQQLVNALDTGNKIEVDLVFSQLRMATTRTSTWFGMIQGVLNLTPYQKRQLLEIVSSYSDKFLQEGSGSDSGNHVPADNRIDKTILQEVFNAKTIEAIYQQQIPPDQQSSWTTVASFLSEIQTKAKSLQEHIDGGKQKEYNDNYYMMKKTKIESAIAQTVFVRALFDQHLLCLLSSEKLENVKKYLRHDCVEQFLQEIPFGKSTDRFWPFQNKDVMLRLMELDPNGEPLNKNYAGVTTMSLLYRDSSFLDSKEIVTILEGIDSACYDAMNSCKSWHRRWFLQPDLVDKAIEKLMVLGKLKPQLRVAAALDNDYDDFDLYDDICYGKTTTTTNNNNNSNLDAAGVPLFSLPNLSNSKRRRARYEACKSIGKDNQRDYDPANMPERIFSEFGREADKELEAQSYSVFKVAEALVKPKIPLDFIFPTGRWLRQRSGLHPFILETGETFHEPSIYPVPLVTSDGAQELSGMRNKGKAGKGRKGKGKAGKGRNRKGIAGKGRNRKGIAGKGGNWKGIAGKGLSQEQSAGKCLNQEQAAAKGPEEDEEAGEAVEEDKEPVKIHVIAPVVCGFENCLSEDLREKIVEHQNERGVAIDSTSPGNERTLDGPFLPDCKPEHFRGPPGSRPEEPQFPFAAMGTNKTLATRMCDRKFDEPLFAFSNDLTNSFINAANFVLAQIYEQLVDPKMVPEPDIGILAKHLYEYLILVERRNQHFHDPEHEHYRRFRPVVDEHKYFPKERYGHCPVDDLPVFATDEEKKDYDKFLEEREQQTAGGESDSAEKTTKTKQAGSIYDDADNTDGFSDSAEASVDGDSSTAGASVDEKNLFDDSEEEGQISLEGSDSDNQDSDTEDDDKTTFSFGDQSGHCEQIDLDDQEICSESTQPNSGDQDDPEDDLCEESPSPLSDEAETEEQCKESLYKERFVSNVDHNLQINASSLGGKSYWFHQDACPGKGYQLTSPEGCPIYSGHGLRFPTNKQMVVCTFVLGDNYYTGETCLDFAQKEAGLYDWMGGLITGRNFIHLQLFGCQYFMIHHAAQVFTAQDPKHPNSARLVMTFRFHMDPNREPAVALPAAYMDGVFKHNRDGKSKHKIIGGAQWIGAVSGRKELPESDRTMPHHDFYEWKWATGWEYKPDTADLLPEYCKEIERVPHPILPRRKLLALSELQLAYFCQENVPERPLLEQQRDGFLPSPLTECLMESAMAPPALSMEPAVATDAVISQDLESEIPKKGSAQATTPLALSLATPPPLLPPLPPLHALGTSHTPTNLSAALEHAAKASPVVDCTDSADSSAGMVNYTDDGKTTTAMAVSEARVAAEPVLSQTPVARAPVSPVPPAPTPLPHALSLSAPKVAHTPTDLSAAQEHVAAAAKCQSVRGVSCSAPAELKPSAVSARVSTSPVAGCADSADSSAGVADPEASAPVPSVPPAPVPPAPRTPTLLPKPSPLLATEAVHTPTDLSAAKRHSAATAECYGVARDVAEVSHSAPAELKPSAVSAQVSNSSTVDCTALGDSSASMAESTDDDKTTSVNQNPITNIPPIIISSSSSSSSGESRVDQGDGSNSDTENERASTTIRDNVCLVTSDAGSPHTTGCTGGFAINKPTDTSPPSTSGDYADSTTTAMPQCTDAGMPVATDQNHIITSPSSNDSSIAGAFGGLSSGIANASLCSTATGSLSSTDAATSDTICANGNISLAPAGITNAFCLSPESSKASSGLSKGATNAVTPQRAVLQKRPISKLFIVSDSNSESPKKPKLISSSKNHSTDIKSPTEAADMSTVVTPTSSAKRAPQSNSQLDEQSNQSFAHDALTLQDTTITEDNAHPVSPSSPQNCHGDAVIEECNIGNDPNSQDEGPALRDGAPTKQDSTMLQDPAFTSLAHEEETAQADTPQQSQNDAAKSKEQLMFDSANSKKRKLILPTSCHSISAETPKRPAVIATKESAAAVAPFETRGNHHSCCDVAPSSGLGNTKMSCWMNSGLQMLRLILGAESINKLNDLLEEVVLDGDDAEVFKPILTRLAQILQHMQQREQVPMEELRSLHKFVLTTQRFKDCKQRDSYYDASEFVDLVMEILDAGRTNDKCLFEQLMLEKYDFVRESICSSCGASRTRILQEHSMKLSPRAGETLQKLIASNHDHDVRKKLDCPNCGIASVKKLCEKIDLSSSNGRPNPMALFNGKAEELPTFLQDLAAAVKKEHHIADGMFAPLVKSLLGAKNHNQYMETVQRLRSEICCCHDASTPQNHQSLANLILRLLTPECKKRLEGQKEDYEIECKSGNGVQRIQSGVLMFLLVLFMAMEGHKTSSSTNTFNLNPPEKLTVWLKLQQADGKADSFMALEECTPITFGARSDAETVFYHPTGLVLHHGTQGTIQHYNFLFYENGAWWLRDDAEAQRIGSSWSDLDAYLLDPTRNGPLLNSICGVFYTKWSDVDPLTKTGVITLDPSWREKLQMPKWEAVAGQASSGNISQQPKATSGPDDASQADDPVLALYDRITDHCYKEPRVAAELIYNNQELLCSSNFFYNNKYEEQSKYLLEWIATNIPPDEEFRTLSLGEEVNKIVQKKLKSDKELRASPLPGSDSCYPLPYIPKDVAMGAAAAAAPYEAKANHHSCHVGATTTRVVGKNTDLVQQCLPSNKEVVSLATMASSTLLSSVSCNPLTQQGTTPDPTAAEHSQCIPKLDSSSTSLSQLKRATSSCIAKLPGDFPKDPTPGESSPTISANLATSKNVPTLRSDNESQEQAELPGCISTSPTKEECQFDLESAWRNRLEFIDEMGGDEQMENVILQFPFENFNRTILNTAVKDLPLMGKPHGGGPWHNHEWWESFLLKDFYRLVGKKTAADDVDLYYLSDPSITVWRKWLPYVCGQNEHIARLPVSFYVMYSTSHSPTRFGDAAKNLQNHCKRHGGKNVFERRLLLFPVSLGKHWSLFAISINATSINANSPPALEFFHLDSLPGCHPTARIAAFCKKVLNSAWQDIYPESSHSNPFDGYHVTQLMNVPWQGSAFDCGIFTCMYMQTLYLLWSDPKFDKTGSGLDNPKHFQFGQEDATNFRKQFTQLIIRLSKLFATHSSATKRKSTAKKVPRNASAFTKGREPDDVVLVFPFKNLDRETIREAVDGLAEMTWRNANFHKKLPSQPGRSQCILLKDLNRLVVTRKTPEDMCLDENLINLWTLWIPYSLGSDDSIHCFSASFCKTLMEGKDEEDLQGCYRKGGIDIFKKKLLLFPFNHDKKHWSLFVIENPGGIDQVDKKTKQMKAKFLHLSSWKGKGQLPPKHDKIKRPLFDWLNDTYMAHRKKKRPFYLSKCTAFQPSVPKLEDHFDSGVFTCLYILRLYALWRDPECASKRRNLKEAIETGIPEFQFGQESIKKFRSDYHQLIMRLSVASKEPPRTRQFKEPTNMISSTKVPLSEGVQNVPRPCKRRKLIPMQSKSESSNKAKDQRVTYPGCFKPMRTIGAGRTVGQLARHWIVAEQAHKEGILLEVFTDGSSYQEVIATCKEHELPMPGGKLVAHHDLPVKQSDKNNKVTTPETPHAAVLSRWYKQLVADLIMRHLHSQCKISETCCSTVDRFGDKLELEVLVQALKNDASLLEMYESLFEIDKRLAIMGSGGSTQMEGSTAGLLIFKKPSDPHFEASDGQTFTDEVNETLKLMKEDQNVVGVWLQLKLLFKLLKSNNDTIRENALLELPEFLRGQIRKSQQQDHKKDPDPVFLGYYRQISYTDEQHTIGAVVQDSGQKLGYVSANLQNFTFRLNGCHEHRWVPAFKLETEVRLRLQYYLNSTGKKPLKLRRVQVSSNDKRKVKCRVSDCQKLMFNHLLSMEKTFNTVFWPLTPHFDPKKDLDAVRELMFYRLPVDKTNESADKFKFVHQDYPEELVGREAVLAQLMMGDKTDKQSEKGFIDTYITPTEESRLAMEKDNYLISIEGAIGVVAGLVYHSAVRAANPEKCTVPVNQMRKLVKQEKIDWTSKTEGRKEHEVAYSTPIHNQKCLTAGKLPMNLIKPTPTFRDGDISTHFIFNEFEVTAHNFAAAHNASSHSYDHPKRGVPPTNTLNMEDPDTPTVCEKHAYDAEPFQAAQLDMQQSTMAPWDGEHINTQHPEIQQPTEENSQRGPFHLPGNNRKMQDTGEPIGRGHAWNLFPKFEVDERYFWFLLCCFFKAVLFEFTGATDELDLFDDWKVEERRLYGPQNFHQDSPIDEVLPRNTKESLQEWCLFLNDQLQGKWNASLGKFVSKQRDGMIPALQRKNLLKMEEFFHNLLPSFQRGGVFAEELRQIIEKPETATSNKRQDVIYQLVKALSLAGDFQSENKLFQIAHHIVLDMETFFLDFAGETKPESVHPGFGGQEGGSLHVLSAAEILEFLTAEGVHKDQQAGIQRLLQSRSKKRTTFVLRLKLVARVVFRFLRQNELARVIFNVGIDSHDNLVNLFSGRLFSLSDIEHLLYCKLSIITRQASPSRTISKAPSSHTNYTSRPNPKDWDERRQELFCKIVEVCHKEENQEQFQKYMDVIPDHFVPDDAVHVNEDDMDFLLSRFSANTDNDIGIDQSDEQDDDQAPYQNDDKADDLHQPQEEKVEDEDEDVRPAKVSSADFQIDTTSLYDSLEHLAQVAAQVAQVAKV